jgi:polar amino acid transport system ATP-binding protein
VISVADLSYAYGGGETALDRVSLELETGGIRAILGRSGSGKTTLLMCLAGFLEPGHGTIEIEGRRLQEISELELRRLLGVVFQDLHLFPHLSVIENLTLAPVRVLGLGREEAEARAAETLERFGIGDLAGRYPQEISGGQAQRAAIARALVLRPRYLLLDEPTSALDVQTSREFGEWLVSLQEETTFVIVTHDAVFARDTASSGVLMEAGRVTAAGPIGDILERLDDGGGRGPHDPRREERHGS